MTQSNMMLLALLKIPIANGDYGDSLHVELIIIEKPLQIEAASK